MLDDHMRAFHVWLQDNGSTMQMCNPGDISSVNRPALASTTLQEVCMCMLYVLFYVCTYVCLEVYW